MPSPSPIKKPASNVPLSVKRRKVDKSPSRPSSPSKKTEKELGSEYDFSEEEEEEIVDENGYIRLPAKPVSRETFLANEKLRRQREARNFQYEGSADAPKLTRSGRVIGAMDTNPDLDGDDPFVDKPREVSAIDDYSAMHGDGEEEITTRREDEEVEEENYLEEVIPLPAGAEECVRGILDTLTGRRIAFDPPPFANEEKNEALNGLVNLFKGTVERGEGNSALLTGARGVGKTRVSLIDEWLIAVAHK